jgi:hypothetical protein
MDETGGRFTGLVVELDRVAAVAQEAFTAASEADHHVTANELAELVAVLAKATARHRPHS